MVDIYEPQRCGMKTQCRKIAQERDRLRAENEDLRRALDDATQWNWLDDDAPEDLLNQYVAMANRNEEKT